MVPAISVAQVLTMRPQLRNVAVMMEVYYIPDADGLPRIKWCGLPSVQPSPISMR